MNISSIPRTWHTFKAGSSKVNVALRGEVKKMLFFEEDEDVEENEDEEGEEEEW